MMTRLLPCGHRPNSALTWTVVSATGPLRSGGLLEVSTREILLITSDTATGKWNGLMELSTKVSGGGACQTVAAHSFKSAG